MLLGKLIKLDVDSGVATVVAAGLRNPWRFSFDRATGQIVIADVGDGTREEINVGLAANYGWPCREGRLDTAVDDPRCASGFTDPVLEKTHGPSGDGYCAITGGYVVRDPGLPTLLGRYVYGDNCSPGLRSVDLANPASDAPLGLDVPGLSSFGEDMCGRLFVMSLGGPVYRLVDGAPVGLPGSSAAASAPARGRRAGPARLLARDDGERRAQRAAAEAALAHAADGRGLPRDGARLDQGRRAVPPDDRVGGRREAAGRAGEADGTRRACGARGIAPETVAIPSTLRVSAVDAAGNTRTVTRTVRIRG